MRNISLRKFRAEIVDLDEPVEVSRRDGEGSIQLLGFWTPYGSPEGKLVVSPVPPHALLKIPVDEPAPKIIRTPEEAAAAVAPTVRAFPKSTQTARRKK